MASAVTYEGDLRRSDSNSNGLPPLFAGQKLFFSRTVPQRQWFIDQAKANGATVTPTDNEADVVLFDHARKNPPPGAYSYRYVELSLRNGQLENLGVHLISSASRVDRPVGSITTASKGGRNAFTDAEDQLLWNWITPYMRAGGSWKGNEIYKQLERHNPRHTFQSWRDRWIKHTQYQKRQITADVDPFAEQEDISDNHHEPNPQAQPTQNSATSANVAKPVVTQTSNPIQASSSSAVQSNQSQTMGQEQSVPVNQPSPSQSEDLPLVKGFTAKDAQSLFRAVPTILICDPDRVDKGWTEMVNKRGGPSKRMWQRYFHEIIVPEYRARNKLEDDQVFERYIEDHRLAVLETKIEEADDDDSGSDGQIFLSASQNDAPDTTPTGSDAASRLPGANESRKRSQGRSTQSSTQSNDLPTQTQSTANNSLPDIPYRDNSLQTTSNQHTVQQKAGNTSGPRTDEEHHSVHQDMSLKRRHESSAASHIDTKKRRREQQNLEPDIVSIKSEESDAEIRFVTQLTGNQISQIEDDKPNIYSSESAADPAPTIRKENGRNPMTKPNKTQEDNGGGPLFYPEEASSPPMVQLVDDDDVSGTLVIPTSPSTASDAASEHIAFDDSIDLSHAWDTAPQGDAGESEPSLIETDRIVNNITRAKNVPGERTSMSGEDASDTSESTFTENPADQASAHETAPQTQPHSHPDRRALDDVQENIEITAKRRAEQSRMDTQDLFKHPLAPHIENASFTIPPPEGGWDDDGEQAAIATEQHSNDATHESELAKPARIADGAKHRPKDQTLASEADEVDAWLGAQKLRHLMIEPAVLDEVCMKALGATSMDLDLATRVVHMIVRKVEKGKDPALARLSDESHGRRRSSSSRRKARRQRISQVVDDLMPTDQRGVWTKDDDTKLTGTNARLVEELARKHGEESVNLRFEYLDQYYNDE